jgi:hypothetical protein
VNSLPVASGAVRRVDRQDLAHAPHVDRDDGAGLLATRRYLAIEQSDIYSVVCMEAVCWY